MGGHNEKLERWTIRLCARSHQVLLLLLEGKLSGKQIAHATGALESSVSRIRLTYERLSGKSLPRTVARRAA